MKLSLYAVILCILLSTPVFAAKKQVDISADPASVTAGENVLLVCEGDTNWQAPLISATINIKAPDRTRPVSRGSMAINGTSASYTFPVPSTGISGNWQFSCVLRDDSGRARQSGQFAVLDVPTDPTEPPPDPTDPPPDPTDPPPDPTDPPPDPTDPPPDPTDPPPGPTDPPVEGPIAAHNTINSYNGPTTCISCHTDEAEEMLDSLHMNWSGPTPELINTNGEDLGKAVGGINTFCTYAMSSKGACFSCHVRADGNAPDAPQAEDVDCLMCHSDTYQRKFVSDPDNPVTVTDYLGEEKTYIFGKVDAEGNYMTVPDYDKMPAGTNMVNVARTVTMPTTQSCLRCHATAGGGDWTKRGDMGLNSATATPEQDVHLAKGGANLSCVNCHSALDHKISGRGIDLRQTEAPDPTCQACHSEAPHTDATLNRHATGQVSCQVCHIREYAKGGATEMSRNWTDPVWNPAFCSGQGGFVGHEVKESNVKPEYVWFDGTSYVYNIGETIEPNPVTGVYNTARAQGGPFDGKSSIVPIKRHFTNWPLHEDGQIIPPAIMWMFMTGDFDQAVQKGMEEQGMTGDYSLVVADAEMLITHGVEPKEMAPSCVECHDGSGSTPDGTGMVPFGALGYQELPEAVTSCNLCHESKNMQWEDLHRSHRQDDISCSSCHTPEPTGFIEPEPALCSSCHENKSWNSKEGHKKHINKGIACDSCHTFS